MDRRRLGGPRLPPLLFILGCLGLIVYPTEAKITSSTWKLADDDDGKGLDDDVPSFSDALGAWTVVNSGKSCYTATKVLEGVGLRMCPLISAQPLDFSGKPYVWVNGTVTNVGRNKLCGFSFTSMDSDLSVATKVPPDLPVLNTTEIAVGETVPYAFLLPVDIKTLQAPFVSMSDDVLPCANLNVGIGVQQPAAPTAQPPNILDVAPGPAPAPVVGAAPQPAPVAAENTGGRPPLQDSFTSSPVFPADVVRVTSPAPARPHAASTLAMLLVAVVAAAAHFYR